jgi:uncharacterized protein YbaA (DUF1428 family)
LKGIEISTYVDGFVLVVPKGKESEYEEDGIWWV